MDSSDISTVEVRLRAAAEAVRRSEERATAGQLALELMHEIRNPLEALGHLTYLTHADADDSTKVRHYMSLAEEQMATLRQVAGQTLGFARPSQSPKPFHLHLLAHASLRLHQRTINAKKIHLVKDLPDDVIAEIHTGEMLQVLSNVILNALDALPAEGTLHLRMRKTPAEVHLLIADNGHGIGEDHIKRVFEPFFTTKEERGNGLGLVLSKKIVERHRGKIRLRSSVRSGKSGTIFKISLPCRA